MFGEDARFSLRGQHVECKRNMVLKKDREKSGVAGPEERAGQSDLDSSAGQSSGNWWPRETLPSLSRILT